MKQLLHPQCLSSVKRPGFKACLLALFLAACGSTSPATDARPSPTSTPIVWPLDVQLDDSRQSVQPTLDALLQLTPGTATLQDVYALIGHPQRRADLAGGVALLYPSLWVKSPHVVVLDGETGQVLLVAIENVSKPIFSREHLTAVYGEPVAAYSDARDFLFFPGAGIAAIVYPREGDDVIYVQLLAQEITLEAYTAHEGYRQETFGFVP